MEELNCHSDVFKSSKMELVGSSAVVSSRLFLHIVILDYSVPPAEIFTFYHKNSQVSLGKGEEELCVSQMIPAGVTAET